MVSFWLFSQALSSLSLRRHRNFLLRSRLLYGCCSLRCVCLTGSIFSALLCLWSRLYLPWRISSGLKGAGIRPGEGKIYPQESLGFFQFVSHLQKDQYRERLATLVLQHELALGVHVFSSPRLARARQGFCRLLYVRQFVKIRLGALGGTAKPGWPVPRSNELRSVLLAAGIVCGLQPSSMGGRRLASGPYSTGALEA
jgi:hypothetical protein